MAAVKTRLLEARVKSPESISRRISCTNCWIAIDIPLNKKITSINYCPNCGSEFEHEATISDVCRCEIVAREIIEELSDLGAYISNAAVNTKSIYIKFKNPKMLSLRVSDHKGKSKYSFRWNIMIGGKDFQKRDRGKIRAFYNENELQYFYKDIREKEKCLKSKPQPK